jgi:alanine dehydrogenase
MEIENMFNRKLIDSFSEQLGRVWVHITNELCSKNGYSALLKAGVVLIATALISVIQAGNLLYEKEISAHKAKFTIEANQKVTLQKIDCYKLPPEKQVECLITKHELSTLNSSFSLLNNIVQTGLWLGLLCMLIACVGFLFAPLIRARQN